jgi:HK97 family phage major capsid protein
MQVSSEVLNIIAEALQSQHGFSTKSELDRAIADVLQKTAERVSRGPQFSLSKMIRGLRAMKSDPIVPSSAEEDAAYCKALVTTGTPGSYLVPTLQADTIISMLAQSSILRAAGCRVWPMSGMQKLQIPISLASPAFIWRAQNSLQSPSDPNLSQISFDLKEQMAIVAVPNSLLKASVPAFDQVLASMLGLGAGESEDAALMASSTTSGGPPCLYTFAGTSTALAAGGNANGGTLTYADLLGLMQKAAEAKARGPFFWAMSPRTWFSRILGMIDTSSRPLAVPTLASGLGPAVGYALFGYPVFISANISNAEANGSGSSQSHIIFANASYLHLAEQDSLEIGVSQERFFDADQTAIRCLSRIDFAVAPAAGVCILKGIA